MITVTAPNTLTDAAILYNARDVVATRMLVDKLDAEFTPAARWIYNFMMDLQRAFMIIDSRGLLLDETKTLAKHNQCLARCARLGKWARAHVQHHLSPTWEFSIGSATQVKTALYGEGDVAPCPICNNTGRVVTQNAVCEPTGEVYKSGPRKGEPKMRVLKERSRRCTSPHTHPGYGLTPYVHHKTKKPTIIRPKLQLLVERESGTPAARLARARLLYERYRKIISFLKAPRAPNGTFPFSTNVPGTKTLRFTTKKNLWGEGASVQNLDKKEIEPLLIPDPGYWLGSRDLSRAESHLLARLAQDNSYIEAHEGPYDTHVYVASLCWPQYPWTGDPAKDLKIATTTYIHGRKLRDMSKAVQHAIGRLGTKYAIARTTKTTLAFADEVLEAFKAKFPKTIAYLNEFWYSLRHTEILTVDFGTALWQFPVVGNPYDVETARQMISNVLQSGVWYVAAEGMRRCWVELDSKAPIRGVGEFQLLRNKHDAFDYQIQKGYEHLDAEVDKYMCVPLIIHGKPLIIPNEGGLVLT